MDDLYSDTYLPGEFCPLCDSENTVIKVTLTSGFMKMNCEECGHDWHSDGTSFEDEDDYYEA